LKFGTDGSISPRNALKEASSLLADHFSYILSGKDTPVAATKK